MYNSGSWFCCKWTTKAEINLCIWDFRLVITLTLICWSKVFAFPTVWKTKKKTEKVVKSMSKTINTKQSLMLRETYFTAEIYVKITGARIKGQGHWITVYVQRVCYTMQVSPHIYHCCSGIHLNENFKWKSDRWKFQLFRTLLKGQKWNVYQVR